MKLGRFGEGLFSFRDGADPKPFIDHLEDLRVMLIKSAATLAIFMVAGFIFRSEIAEFIQRPLHGVTPPGESSLHSLGVGDSLTISFELSFYAGMVLAFPFLLYYLAEFVLPGLTPREKKAVLPASLAGFSLFLTGAACSYFIILPQTLAWMYGDQKAMGWTPQWTVREYYSFTTQFVIGFGLAFELPVVVLLLVRIGVLDTEKLRKLRPYAVILILLFAAIITPTTDILTLALMAAPMYLLYEGSILVAHITEKRQKKKNALLESGTEETTDSPEPPDK